MAIEMDTVVVRNDQPMNVQVDDDLVILNMAGDNYIALDDIGRRIWVLLESPSQVADLCRQLGQEFDGDEAVIAGDVLNFLNELQGEGLLIIGDSQQY